MQIEAVVRAVREAGAELPRKIEAEAIAFGPEIVPALLAVLAESPEGSHAVVHAGRLLGRLKDPAALGPLIAMLGGGGLRSRVASHALVMYFEVAVEALLAAPSGSRRYELDRASLLALLAHEDERVYRHLLEVFAANAGGGAIMLATYGDPRAIQPLTVALARLPDTAAARVEAWRIIDAIRRLGGDVGPTALLRFGERPADY
jgi:hypothetical protein